MLFNLAPTDPLFAGGLVPPLFVVIGHIWARKIDTSSKSPRRPVSSIQMDASAATTFKSGAHDAINEVANSRAIVG